MFHKILIGVVGLFALSAFDFPTPAPAATRLGPNLAAATTFQATSAQTGFVGIAAKPGPAQLKKHGEKRFLLQGKKKGDPKAKWCTVGHFKTRKEAEKAKKICERQNPDFEWQIVITTPGHGGHSNKK